METKGDFRSWVPFACLGYEVLSAHVGERFPETVPMTTALYFEWRERLGLRSHGDVAAALGVSRKTPQSWCHRSNFPDWLHLAFIGLQQAQKNEQEARDLVARHNKQSSDLSERMASAQAAHFLKEAGVGHKAHALSDPQSA